MWKKGIHESEEHKKKISEILKEGYELDNESKVIEKINRFLFDTR